MATWHQSKNPAMALLWQGDPTRWKCISDRHNGFASQMLFPDEATARAYAARTGHVVIPPRRPLETVKEA